MHLVRTSIRLDLCVQQQQDLLTVAQQLWHMPSLPAKENLTLMLMLTLSSGLFGRTKP